MVSCRLAVTVVPDCATFATWALKLGAPQELAAVTAVEASAEVFPPSIFPVRSVARLKNEYECPTVPRYVADAAVVLESQAVNGPPESDT